MTHDPREWKLTRPRMAELLSLLGKFPDRVLARRFGVSHSRVNHLRRSRQIPVAKSK